MSSIEWSSSNVHCESGNTVYSTFTKSIEACLQCMSRTWYTAKACGLVMTVVPNLDTDTLAKNWLYSRLRSSRSFLRLSSYAPILLMSPASPPRDSCTFSFMQPFFATGTGGFCKTMPHYRHVA